MTTQIPAATISCGLSAPSSATTRSLLTCAVVASPLWAVVSLAQAVVREGFDITRHPLSALSNGGLGWLQITNFLLAGTGPCTAPPEAPGRHGWSGSTASA